MAVPVLCEWEEPTTDGRTALGIADGSGREGRGLPSDIRVGVSGDLGGASSRWKERLAAEVSRPSWGEELEIWKTVILQTSFSAGAGQEME